MSNIITIVPSRSHLSEFIYSLIEKASQEHTVYALKPKTLDPKVKQRIKNYNIIDYEQYRKITLDSQKREKAQNLIQAIEKKLKISFRSIICADRHISYYYMDKNIDYAYNQLTQDSEDYKEFHDIMYRLVLYIDELIQSLNPKYLIMSSSNYLGAAFIAVGNYYGIKSYMVMHSVLLSGLDLRMVLVNQHNWFNFKAQELFQREEIVHSNEAKQVLDNYLNKPKSPIKLSTKLDYRGKIRNLLSRIYQSLRGRIDTKAYDQSFIFSIFVNTLKTFFKYKSQSRMNLTNIDLKKEKYAYFALGALPELTLLENAPEFIHQANSIEQVSRYIPFDTKLGVREHPINIGRRPLGFHKHILNLGNTLLLSFKNSPFEIMQQSEAVITINGTTGWEGLIYKKPVFFFEGTFYDTLGLAKRLENFQELESGYLEHQEFIKNFDDEEYYQIILNYLQSEIDGSYEESSKGVEEAYRILEEDSVTDNDIYNYWNKQ